MEPPERSAASSHKEGDEDAIDASINPKGARGHSDATRGRGQSRLEIEAVNPLQLEFQDSNLSPALSLLPSTSGVEHNFTECSLFQQSETEFVPLRAYPDVSVASERFHFAPQDWTTHSSERGSLSQHPLSQTTILSEEDAISSCSLSERSLLLGNKGKEDQMNNPPVTSNTYEEQGVQSVGGTNPTDKLVCEAAEDETFFLRKDVPAQHLLKLLQKEVGMPSSTSSAVSSASETSLNTASSAVESKITKVTELIITDRSMVKRAGGPVETHLAQHQTARPESVSDPDQSGARSSGTANVTLGPRSTLPDDSSELLHRELLSEVERLSSLEAGAENKPRINPTPPDPSATPALKEMSEGKPSLVVANLGGRAWTGPFSAGVERVHREQELWSSGNQTGIDGSYLGFLPQSQSTPGVFMVPPKSGVKAKLGQLSAIESDKENQSSSGAASQSAVPMTDTRRSEIAGRCQEEALQTSAQVQSLPTLNYMQKVDAWRANQSPRGTPLFDSLTLQGFSSMPPKKKAFDAPSDTLNRVLTQHSQQPPVLGASNRNIDQGSSTAAAGSSFSKRGEAVGGGPCDKPDRGPAPSPARGSSFGKSQSVSSLSTVVASARQPQQTVTPPEPQEAASQERAPPHPGANPSPLTGLGHFSDTSHDQDVTPSSSQDSFSGVKVGLSVGASSVVSLELDHYTPNWPTKPPAFPPDLNIDERIPLYLRNLGIDQSPSSILTPFAPRGPIREPEFSPTDFCTVKGSTGTPTKNTQPSEAGSPHKAEFSRSSILSVDSSVSAPLSLDSLGPAAQARVRAAPPDTRSALSSTPRQPEPSDRSQDGHSDSPLPSSRAAEDSLVSSTTLSEIRKVLSHADNLVSTGSSAGPNHHSDEDLFLSLPTKASTSADPRSYTSLRWARSQPDPAQSPVGREAPSHSPSKAKPTPPAAAVPSQSARRTEPEGCSAAPPDKVPAQPPLSAAAAPQPPPTPADGGGAPGEGERPTTRVPAQSVPSSPVPEDADPEDADPGAVSDGSSESSLAVRVARLLQSGSPSTMVSSTDQEESKAREWIKLKISGQQCEPLELDIEDRKRIEEIKKELLLRNPMKSQGSTDTESSAVSFVRVDREQEPAQSSRTGSLLSDVSSRRGGATGPPESGRQLRKTLHSNLEVAVCEIAAREGVLLPARRTPAPPVPVSPSPSSAPSSSPALEPLHLTELSTGRPLVADAPPTSYLDGGRGTGLTPPAATEPPPVCGQSSSFHPGDQSGASQSVSGRQMREDTAGGGCEAPPPLVQSTDEEDENVKTAGSFKHLENFPVQGTPARAFAPSSVGTGHASRGHVPQSLQTARHTSSPAVSLPPRGAAALPGDSSSAASSPDEGVGSSSPAEWCDTRQRAGRGAPGRSAGSRLFKAVRATQPVAPPHKNEAPPPTPFTAAPAPVLLPYKPRGSEELFYVPQRKADVSSTVPSDTTMESSHTGSDDAVPPRFSSEVLGHQDPGLDRGVTFRHADGIYSKRLRTGTLRMQAAERSWTTGAPPVSSQKVSTRDQGTSPIRPLQREQAQPDAERYQLLREAERGQTPVPRTRGQPDREAASGSLDGLWQKFCSQWEEEESRPAAEHDASLLERLERLSRLLHGTKAPQAGGGGAEQRPDQTGRGRTEAGENSPMEGGRSEDLSASSGSMSTVDTARLVRAFGAHKVQPLTSGSSLSKLYSTISKQREEREGRGGRNKDPPRAATPSEISATNHRVAPESASSSSTYTPLSDRGPSRLLAAKKAVRLVSKSIQTGDLEIVCNGTRRHTRDVGTTFPSPGGSGRSGPASWSSSSTPRGEGGRRSPSKSQGVQKQRKNKRSPSKPFPEGVSWFISVENMRSEAKKENRPEQPSSWRPTTAWFEPYSRASPWREPLRQRQVHEETSPRSTLNAGAEAYQHHRSKTQASAPPRVSLQEALEMRRPGFIWRSKQRMRSLALQMEERRLQAAFGREGDAPWHQAGGRPAGLPRPAGIPLQRGGVPRRAVPRKEMIQRSKQIYESLPEVQRKKEQERRKAEYRSYRLNAQLYNQRVRNRVLGRRSAWE